MEAIQSTFRKEEHPESTSLQSSCSPDRVEALEQGILAYRKKLSLVSETVHDDKDRFLTIRSVFILHVQFTKTEITKCNMTRVVEKNVFGF
jgi:hypothetical protein